jgi:hypothetical protein
VGDDVATGVYDPPPAAHGPARWVRAGYEALYEPLSELPSAATSCPLDGLDVLLDPVERALTDWFASVGFRWSGGPVHFDVRLTDPARLAREIDLGHEDT